MLSTKTYADTREVPLDANCTSLAALTNGRLAVGSRDGTLRVVDPFSGAPFLTISPFANARSTCVTAICALRNGGLAFCATDKRLRVLADDRAAAPAAASRAVAAEALVCLADGTWVVTGGEELLV